MQNHVFGDVTLRGWPLAPPGMPSARPARGTFWHRIHRRFAVTGRITAYGCHTCHQYVRGGRRAPDRPSARHIGRAQSISFRRQMTSLQGIQASSWSHVHVTPDVIVSGYFSVPTRTVWICCFLLISRIPCLGSGSRTGGLSAFGAHSCLVFAACCLVDTLDTNPYIYT